MRRAIAYLLLASFSFFTIEVAVADVHDGDASASEIAQLSVDAPGAPNAPLPSPNGPTHDVHVCHCAHTHGGLSARALALPQLVLRPGAKLTLDVRAPSTVDRDIHLRPPIA